MATLPLRPDGFLRVADVREVSWSDSHFDVMEEHVEIVVLGACRMASGRCTRPCARPWKAITPFDPGLGKELPIAHWI